MLNAVKSVRKLTIPSHLRENLHREFDNNIVGPLNRPWFGEETVGRIGLLFSSLADLKGFKQHTSHDKTAKSVGVG